MQTTDDRTQTSVGDDLRSRVVLPIALPIGVLAVMVVFIGTVAYALLNSTRGLAIVVAGIMATGLMVAMSLASAIDEEDMTGAKRAVIVLTGLAPLLAGVAIAAAGAVPAEERAINVEPPLLAPEGAVVGAENSETFCEVVEGEEACAGPTDSYTLPAQPDSPVFAFEFFNTQAGIQHNFQIFTLVDGGQGEPVFTQDVGGVGGQNAATIGGGETIVYQVDTEAAGVAFEPGAEFYYNCIIHPAMQGILTIGDPVA